MKVIKPVTIASGMLLSSTVPEIDYAAWNAGTAYIVGNRCILLSTHKIYECAQPNTGFSPDVNLTGVTPKWLEVGATLRWQMFDEYVGTATTATSSMTVRFSPGLINSVALMEMTGSQVTFTMEEYDGGPVIYTATKILDGTSVLDWYDYFFQPYKQLKEWVVQDLPPYVNCVITVTITGSGTVGIGVCSAGIIYYIGGTQYGASAGITDYSYKSTDTFGRTTIVKRKYAKRSDVHLFFANDTLNRVYALLADIRSTPCVWVGTDIDTFGPLFLYGFYKDFSIEIPYAEHSLCSLQIEGMT